MYSALSTLNTMTEVPLSKALQHKWLPTAPGVCSWCVCSLLCVCTLDGLLAEHKFRVWVTILGRMSRHFHFSFIMLQNISSSNQFCSFKLYTVSHRSEYTPHIFVNILVYLFM